MKRLALLVVLAAAIGCGRGTPTPLSFDAAHEPCRSCRMVGSNGRFAAQIVSDSHEPLFFDDIVCLRSFLLAAPAPVDGVTFVVDHRTGEWVAAQRALFSRNERIATPMSSHLLAHASDESRQADSQARGGTPMSFAEVFAGVHVPGGSQ